MNNITFCAASGASELAANAFVLEARGLRLLLDAGAPQNRRPAWVDGLERPDVCWISHAHFDHIGALAPLMARHVGLPCLASSTTRRLAPLALEGGGVDGARARAVASQLNAVPSRQYFELSRLSAHPQAESVRLMSFPAGHIPGAAMLLVEVDVGDERPFRVMYTGDFCGHDQPLVDGALFPKTGEAFPIDVLVMEGVFATKKRLDEIEYGDELERLKRAVSERDGAALLGVSTLGEAAPVSKALVEAGCKLHVHRMLEPVLKACWPGWPEAPVTLVDGGQARRALGAGKVVVAPGEHYAQSTPAGRALGSVVHRDDGLVVVLNRAHRKSVASKLLRASRGKRLNVGGRSVTLEARVERFLLPNHAPRGQLVATARAVDPERLLLVHGHRSQLFALKRAIQKAGFDGAVEVPENGVPVVLA